VWDGGGAKTGKSRAACRRLVDTLGTTEQLIGVDDPLSCYAQKIMIG